MALPRRWGWFRWLCAGGGVVLAFTDRYWLIGDIILWWDEAARYGQDSKANVCLAVWVLRSETNTLLVSKITKAIGNRFSVLHARKWPVTIDLPFPRKLLDLRFLTRSPLYLIDAGGLKKFSENGSWCAAQEIFTCCLIEPPKCKWIKYYCTEISRAASWWISDS